MPLAKFAATRPCSCSRGVYESAGRTRMSYALRKFRGTVQQNFRSAYDILVRPADSYTPLEQEQGLVAANFASGIFGGISLRQWHQIEDVPGVDVAAPIANIGYVVPYENVKVLVNRYL